MTAPVTVQGATTGPDGEHYPVPFGHERAVVGSARMRDGTVLRTRRWEVATPWAAALIVHGISEHSGRYEGVGSWLRAAGIDAHAYDQRGWGASEGTRGHVERWSIYLDDAEEILAGLRARHPGLPIVLYGHSMGGLIATGYVLDGRPLPDLLVLTAPGVDSTHPRWLKVVAKVLGRVAPRMRPPVAPYEQGVLSRDPEVDRLYRSDPLRVYEVTAGFGLAALGAQQAARDAIDALAAAKGSFPIPTLLLHGTTDRLVPFAATERYAGVGAVTRRAYAGLRHELHNEPEGERIVGEIVDWVRDQVSDQVSDQLRDPARR